MRESGTVWVGGIGGSLNGLRCSTFTERLLAASDSSQRLETRWPMFALCEWTYSSPSILNVDCRARGPSEMCF